MLTELCYPTSTIPGDKTHPLMAENVFVCTTWYVPASKPVISLPATQSFAQPPGCWPYLMRSRGAVNTPNLWSLRGKRNGQSSQCTPCIWLLAPSAAGVVHHKEPCKSLQEICIKLSCFHLCKKTCFYSRSFVSLCNNTAAQTSKQIHRIV